MGQRHQIYAITLNEKGETELNAWHDQWCYGTLPLRNLYRVAKFCKEAESYNTLIGKESLYDKKAILTSLLSTDYTTGSYSNTFDITPEVLHDGHLCPEYGDNNDGITVFDLRKEFRYCFMFISNYDYNDLNREPFVPLSAEQYVSCYYSPVEEKWKSLKIPTLLKKLSTLHLNLMTEHECIKLFPSLYKERIENQKTLTCSSKELTLYLGDVFPSTKRIVEARLKDKPISIRDAHLTKEEE